MDKLLKKINNKLDDKERLIELKKREIKTLKQGANLLRKELAICERGYFKDNMYLPSDVLFSMDLVWGRKISFRPLEKSKAYYKWKKDMRYLMKITDNVETNVSFEINDGMLGVEVSFKQCKSQKALINTLARFIVKHKLKVSYNVYQFIDYNIHSNLQEQLRKYGYRINI